MRCGVVRLVTRKSPCDLKIRRKGWNSIAKHVDTSALCNVAESKIIGRCCAHKICRVVDKSSKVLCNNLSSSNCSKRKTIFNKTPLINRLDHLNNFNSDYIGTDNNIYNKKVDNSKFNKSVPKLSCFQSNRTSKTFRNKKCGFYSIENPTKPGYTLFKLPHSSSRYHCLRKSESVRHRSSCDSNLQPCMSYIDCFEAVKRRRLHPIAYPLVRHLQNSDFHSFINNGEMEMAEADCTGGLINPNIINHLNETSCMSLCGCESWDTSFKSGERKGRINKFLNRKLSKILNFYRQKNLRMKLHQEKGKYESNFNKTIKRCLDSTAKHSRPIYEPSIDQKRCGRYRQVTEFRDNFRPTRKRSSKSKFNYVRYPTSIFDGKSNSFNLRDKIDKNNSKSDVNIGSKIYNGLKTCGELLTFGMSSKSGSESKAIQTNTLNTSGQPQNNHELLKNNVYNLTRKYCYGSQEDNVGDQIISSMDVSFKYPGTINSKHDTTCDTSVCCSLSEEFKSRHNPSNSSHDHTAVYNNENEKCYDLLSRNIASSYNSMFDCDLATTSNYSKSYENNRAPRPFENTQPFSEESIHKYNYFNKKDELNANSSSHFDGCKNHFSRNTIDGCNSVQFSRTNSKVQTSTQNCIRNETNSTKDYSGITKNTDATLKHFDSRNTECHTSQSGPTDSINDFIANNDARYKEKEDLVKKRSNFSIFSRSAWMDTLVLPESDLLSKTVDVSKPHFNSGFNVKKDESLNLSRFSEINIAIQKVRKKIENIMFDSNETKSIFENEWSDIFHNNLYSESVMSAHALNDFDKNNEQKPLPSVSNMEFNHATNNCTKHEGRNTVNISKSSEFQIDRDSDLMLSNTKIPQITAEMQEGKNFESMEEKDDFDDCKFIYRNDQHIASSVHLNDIIKNIKLSNGKENVEKDDTRREIIKITPQFTGYRVYNQHQSSNQVRKVRFNDSGLTFKPGTERLLVTQTYKRSMSTSSGVKTDPIDNKEKNGNDKLFKDNQNGSIYQADYEKSLNDNHKNVTKEKSFETYIGDNTNKMKRESIEEQITSGLSGNVNTFSKIKYATYQEGCQNELYNKSIKTFAQTNKERSEFDSTEYESTVNSCISKKLSCDSSYFKNESGNIKSHYENNREKILDKCDESAFSMKSKIMSRSNGWIGKMSSMQHIKDHTVRESDDLKSSRSKSAFRGKECEQNSSDSSRRNNQNFAADHSGCIDVGYLGLKLTSFSLEKWHECESSDLNETEKFEEKEKTRFFYAPKEEMSKNCSSNSPIFRNSKFHLKESRTLGMRNKNEMTSDTLNIRNPFSVDSGALRPVSSTCTLNKDDGIFSKDSDDKRALTDKLKNIRKIEKIDYALEERRLANNTPIDTVKVKETYSSPDSSIINEGTQSQSNLKICFKEYERRIKNKPTGDLEDTRQITEELKVVGHFPEGKGTIKGRTMTVMGKQRRKFTALKSHEDSIESTLENITVTGEVSESKNLKPIIDSHPVKKGFVKAILSSPKLPEFTKKKLHNNQESTCEEETNEQVSNKMQKQKTYKKYEGATEKDNYTVEMKKVKPNKLESKESASPRSNASFKKITLKNKVIDKVDSYRHENVVNKEDDTLDQTISEKKHINHPDRIDKSGRDRNSVSLMNSNDDEKSSKVDSKNKQRTSTENETIKTKELRVELDNSKEDTKKVDTKSASIRSKVSFNKITHKNKVTEKVDSYRHKNEVIKEDETLDQTISEKKQINHPDRIDKNAKIRNSGTLMNSNDDVKSSKVNSENKQRMSTENETIKTKESRIGLDNFKEDTKKVEESRRLTNTDKKNTFTVTMGAVTDSEILESKKEEVKNISATFDLNESSSGITSTIKTLDHNKTVNTIKDQSDNEASANKILNTDYSEKENKGYPEEFGSKSSLQNCEEGNENWLSDKKDAMQNMNNKIENDKRSHSIKLSRKYNSTTDPRDESKISTSQTSIDRIIAEQRSMIENLEKSDYTSITNYLENNKINSLKDNSDSSDQLDINKSAPPKAERTVVVTHYKQFHKEKLESDKTNLEAISHTFSYSGDSKDDKKSLDILSDQVENELNDMVTPYVNDFKSNDNSLVTKENMSKNNQMIPKEYYLSLLEKKSFVSSRQREADTEIKTELDDDKTEKSLGRLKFTKAIPAKCKSYVKKSKELLLGTNESTLEKHNQEDKEQNEKELDPNDQPPKSTPFELQAGNLNEDNKEAIESKSLFKKSYGKVYSKSLNFGKIESAVKNSKTTLDKQYKNDINEIRGDNQDESIQSSSQKNDKTIFKSVKNLAKFKQDKEARESFDNSKIKKSVTNIKEKFISGMDKSRKWEAVRRSTREEIVSETPKLEDKGEESSKITKLQTPDTNSTAIESSKANDEESVVTEKTTKKNNLVSDMNVHKQNLFGSDKSLKWDYKSDFFEEVTTVNEIIDTSLKNDDSLKTSDNYLVKPNKTEIKTHLKSTKDEATDRSTEKNILGLNDDDIKWNDKSNFYKEVTTVKETIDAPLKLDDSTKTPNINLAKQLKPEIETRFKSKKINGFKNKNIPGLKDAGVVKVEETKIQANDLKIEKSPKIIETENGPSTIENETDGSKGTEDKNISRIKKSPHDLEVKEIINRLKSIDDITMLDTESQTLTKSDDPLGPTPKLIIKEQEEEISIEPKKNEPQTLTPELLPEVNVEKSKLLRVVEMKPPEDKEMKAWEKEPTYIKNLRPRFYEKKKQEKITNNYYQNELKFQTLMVKNKIVSASKTSDCKNIDCKKEQATWVADMCCSIDKKGKHENAKNKIDDNLPKETPKNKSPDRVPHFRSGRGSRMTEWPDSLSRRREPIIKDPFSPRPRWRP